MLRQLHIRDFTIISAVELELHPGLTALTGETGAGKSIVVDALALALGGRADSAVVRHGCERAEISADFDIGELQALQGWLAEQGLDAGGECLVRRVITSEGRSRGFVNGRPVPMQTLQQLGEWLVDIHGQHEHLSLLRRDAQRELLDDYGDHGALTGELAQAHQRWRTVGDRLAALRRAAQERDTRLELLRFQHQELDALALRAGEFGELEQEYAALSNAGRLLETCQGALATIYDNDEMSLIGTLGRTVNTIERLLDYDRRLEATLQFLRDAQIQLSEAVAELRRYTDGLDLDPAHLREVEERLSGLHDVARKYHVAPEELIPLQQRIARELDELENMELQADRLEKDLAQAAGAYRKLARTLTQRRAEAAKKLSAQVSANMQKLGMPGGQFAVTLEPRPDDEFSPSGMEHIGFQVSANPGQPIKPLGKVASGGELSRISLAIQVITARNMRIPTLIFDEVDVGIGGRVAEIVGKQLRALGQSRQVLCVTHLPQVAAQGHQHLRVIKQARQASTDTRIDRLSETERCDEIARMLGGVEITAQTLAHAKEMVSRAQAV